MKYSFLPELTLEMILLKLAHKPSRIQLEEILSFIEKNRQTSENIKTGSGTPSLSSFFPTSDDQKEHQKSPGIVHNSTLSSQESADQKATLKQKDGFSGLGNTLEQFQKLKKTTVSSPDPESDFNCVLSDIQEKWATIVERVRSHKIALGSFLQEGIPYQTEKGRLIIAYDRHTAFHKEHVEKNSKIIEGILKKDFNLPIRIGFKSIDFKAEGIEQVPRTPEEILEDIKNKEPIIRKIIDVFDLDQVVGEDIG
jgi:hypothetical protein